MSHMTKWKYAVLTVETLGKQILFEEEGKSQLKIGESGETLKCLNKVGAEGWELCIAINDEYGQKLYLKKA